MVAQGDKLLHAANEVIKLDSAIGDVAMCFDWYKQARDADKSHLHGRTFQELRAQLDEAIERMLALS